MCTPVKAYSADSLPQLSKAVFLSQVNQTPTFKAGLTTVLQLVFLCRTSSPLTVQLMQHLLHVHNKICADRTPKQVQHGRTTSYKQTSVEIFQLEKRRSFSSLTACNKLRSSIIWLAISCTFVDNLALS